MDKLEYHPIAEELPEMSDSEYKELLNDIRNNGLREKIVMFEGKILDGRHRAQAIIELGWPLEDYLEEYDEAEGDAAKYAISRNIRRRHLTPGQLAGLALNLVEKVGKFGKGRPSKNGEQGMTQKEAAKAVGSTDRRMREVQEIERVAPEVAKQVKKGTKSIQQGKKEARIKPVAAEHDKALVVISKACGKEFFAQLQSGAFKMTPEEVIEFGGMKPEQMKRIAPLLESGIRWKKAIGYQNMEITPETRLRELWNFQLMEGKQFVHEDKTFGFRTIVQKIKETKPAKKTAAATE